VKKHLDELFKDVPEEWQDDTHPLPSFYAGHPRKILAMPLKKRSNFRYKTQAEP
jgi:hypothetical protein